jgi:hypothetical protein
MFCSGRGRFGCVLFIGADRVGDQRARRGLARARRLDDALRRDELVDDRFDRLFAPRNAQLTGDLGTHELAIEPSGRIVFVASKYSCLVLVVLGRRRIAGSAAAETYRRER